jgi:hypothetical protein
MKCLWDRKFIEEVMSLTPEFCREIKELREMGYKTDEAIQMIKNKNQVNRDRYLVEAMGWEWSEEDEWWYVPGDYPSKDIPNFSTWEDFGGLWTWAKEQEWWNNFLTGTNWDFIVELINPDKFANALYEFLKERHEESDT